MEKMEVKFFTGDRVTNLVPHRDDRERLVPMKAIGHINHTYAHEATVIWWITEYPYHTETKVKYSTIQVYQEQIY